MAGKTPTASHREEQKMSRAESLAEVEVSMSVALRCVVLYFLLMTVCTFAVAGDESLVDLKQRAAGTKGGDQVRVCIEIARLELKEADNAYNAGEVEKAQSAVTELVTYSEEAAQAANSSGKDLKHTELALRSISSKLGDIRRTVNFEDRPPIDAAVNRIENLRSELLATMFKK
jgi:hypothetical protein